MDGAAPDLSTPSCVVSLGHAGSDPRDVGGKAAALAVALAHGARVPAALVVRAAARGDRAAVAGALDAALGALSGDRFAVRSSARAEDGAERSFAGQLESALDVPREGLLDAIESCWRSADALRAVRYGGKAGGVAVIVQEMVAAEAAGVAFSADPRTGARDVVVIEAVRGLADRLLAGEVTPERWRLSEASHETVRRGAPVLDDGQATRIAALVREMERLFGAPQDIEWALAGGELWLLQSRPITALPAAPRPIALEVPAGTWQRDDHHGVLSPLGWAWFQPYPVAMARGMREIGLPIKEMRAARVGGHLYTQMVMDGPESAKPPPRWLLWLASRLIPSLRRANRAAAELIDRETFMDTIARWHAEWRPALCADLDALFCEEPGTLSDEDLLARIGRALALTARGLDHHAELGAPSMFAVGKLVLFLEDELGWEGERALTLVVGSSPKTTELARQIEAIVRAHLAEVRSAGGFPAHWAELCDRCPLLGRALDAWLRDNRLRQLHYDPKHPSLGEQPAYVLSIAEAVARDLLAAATAPAPETDAAAALLEEARSRLSPERMAELERLVALARETYGLRDENGVDTVSRPAGLLRWFVLELGRRLQPALSSHEHAVYLYPEEHGPALRGELADLAARVEQRRGEESWALFHRGPKWHGPPPPPMPPADAFPSGLSRMMRVFAWMMRAEETPAPAHDKDLRGVGIGHRVVEGRARVVDRPDTLCELRHGEVLVCRITSPEWSVGLGRVAAIVTNEGGVLSHPAIIAREYGVPAVLGAELATTVIRTGDRVRVDPVAGRVDVLG